MQKNEIDTPALVLDMDILERNIHRMAGYCREHNINCRPHVKSHKTPEIAALQIESGTIGVTCAKLGEAEVMFEAGIKGILIANQIVGREKIRRLVELNHRSPVMVAIADVENGMQISEEALKSGVQVPVILELEVGMNRCGVMPGEPALELTRKILDMKGLHFKGLMGYEGHAVGTKNINERKAKAEESNRLLVQTSELLRKNGILIEVVSAGGTGTFDMTGSFSGITELQVGSYCLMDMDYMKYENVAPHFACAVTIISQVINCPTAERIVVDVGLKGMTIDNGVPEPKGLSGVRTFEVHEEHTCLRVPGGGKRFKPGERIEFIPTHICTTVNLHDRFYCVRGEEVKGVWSILARGRMQ